MSGPIVFVSRHRIKDGKREGFRRYLQSGTEALQQAAPGTIAFLAYFDADGTDVSIVHVFPDAAAMDAHMAGAASRAAAAFEFIEPVSQEIHGTPSDGVLTAMQRIAGGGVSVRLWPDHVAGFLRLGAD